MSDNVCCYISAYDHPVHSFEACLPYKFVTTKPSAICAVYRSVVQFQECLFRPWWHQVGALTILSPAAAAAGSGGGGSSTQHRESAALALSLEGMPSLHEVISSWDLLPVAVQKFEAWLEGGGWNLTQPPGDGFYYLTEADLLQADLTSVKDRRTIMAALAKLKAAAGETHTWPPHWEAQQTTVVGQVHLVPF